MCVGAVVLRMRVRMCMRMTVIIGMGFGILIEIAVGVVARLGLLFLCAHSTRVVLLTVLMPMPMTMLMVMPMPTPTPILVVVVIAGFVIEATIIVVVVVVVHLSFRHRCRFVVVSADNSDMHPSDRTHPSPPNLLRSYLEFIRQCGHAHGQAFCHVVFQVVGIAGCVQAGRQEHITRGSRKAVEMGMVVALLPVCNNGTGNCRHHSSFGIIRRFF